ncbi:HyaD/HybD family hydrogenase maturation endopeptidase [Magnetovibrio sp.]|uniref:HyaD/HybD family hydrogenase maturation endopeptidase n=1 Tax=Magnetovibrio sp. TaxID=2024836 RepID=UPI002F91DB35
MSNGNTLVLGIGNILWADEGFGVRAVEEFHRRYQTSDDVVIMDGGTQGLYLVQFVQEADNLLVFDAVDYGLDPGEMIVVTGDEVPKFTGAKKMSLHQTGFQEVLSAADFTGHYPNELTLIGVQALDLEDWGGSLTDLVKSKIDQALDIAVKQLRDWGVEVTERTVPLAEGEGLLVHDLGIGAYEAEHPLETAGGA